MFGSATGLVANDFETHENQQKHENWVTLFKLRSQMNIFLQKHLFSQIHRGARDFASKKVWDQRGYPISFGRFSRVSDKWNSEAGKQAVFRAKKSNKNPSFLQKRLDQKLWNKLKFPTHLHQMPIWWIHVFSSCQLVFLSDTTLIPNFIRCSFAQNERLLKTCKNSTQTKPKEVLYIQCF